VEEEKVKKVVREGYAEIAKKRSSCCGQGVSEQLGYSEDELRSLPEGADLSLGCGNPVALASLKLGEIVLDLGSGAGMDCFLAAKKVGAKGHVIGVDMTPEMLDRARTNVRKGSYKNVEFRLGEIENLPVADDAVDVIISNCVINLSPDKPRVFKEVFRVLKHGGRLMVSDIVLLKPLPEAIKRSVKAYVGCLAGAIMKDKYIRAIEDAGFAGVKVVEETQFPLDLMLNDPTAKAVMREAKIRVEDLKGMESAVASVKVSGIKPRA
jgi:SAM-dependent methyltransferase